MDRNTENDMFEFDEAVKNARQVSRNVSDIDDDDDDEEVEAAVRARIEERLGKEDPKKHRRKKRIKAAVLLIIVLCIAVLCAVLLFSCKSSTIFDHLARPASDEAKLISQTLTKDSFSARIDVSGQFGNKESTAVDYDMRVGDLSIVSTNAQGTSSRALYLKDNLLVRYEGNYGVDSYEVSDLGSKTKTPVTLDRRMQQLWERYLRVSGRTNLKKPYEKLFNKYKGKFTRTAGTEEITLLQKPKKLKTEQYIMNGRDFADLLDEALDTFKPGDALYDFVCVFEDEDFSVEDLLDEIDDVRTEILRSDSQFVCTRYIGGGFLGIGDRVLAERYALKLNSAQSSSYELFVKAYSSGRQFDKQIYFISHRNGRTERCCALSLMCLKASGKRYSYSGEGVFMGKNSPQKSFTLSGDAEYSGEGSTATLAAQIQGCSDITKMTADVSTENGRLYIDAQTYGPGGKRTQIKLIPSAANTTFPTQFPNGKAEALDRFVEEALKKANEELGK